MHSARRRLVKAHMQQRAHQRFRRELNPLWCAAALGLDLAPSHAYERFIKQGLLNKKKSSTQFLTNEMW